MKQSAKRFLAKIVKLTKRLQLCLSFGCVFVTESIVFYQKCFFFFRSKLSIFDRDLLRNSSFKSEFVLNLLSSKHSISQQNLNRVVKSSISFLFGVPLLAIGFCVQLLQVPKLILVLAKLREAGGFLCHRGSSDIVTRRRPRRSFFLPRCLAVSLAFVEARSSSSFWARKRGLHFFFSD